MTCPSGSGTSEFITQSINSVSDSSVIAVRIENVVCDIHTQQAKISEMDTIGLLMVNEDVSIGSTTEGAQSGNAVNDSRLIIVNFEHANSDTQKVIVDEVKSGYYYVL